MNTQVPDRTPIVVGVDGSRESDLALKWAAHEAARLDLTLEILHADPRIHLAADAVGADAEPTDRSATVTAGAQRICAAAAAAVRDWEPAVVVRTRPVPLPAVEALVKASRTATAVVIGARGLGAVRSVVLGSVSVQVATQAQCPVVVVREAATRTIPDARVILGSDGFPHSTRAVAYAFEYAAAHGAGLTVVHTWRQDWRDRSHGSDLVEMFKEKYPAVDVRTDVIESDPVTELVRQSENARLLVVGTRGRGAVAGLVEGSVSQDLLRQARCPVAVVH